MSFLQQIANIFRVKEPYAVAIKEAKRGVGETPKISFAKQIEAYNKDTAVRDFVDVLAMQAVGMGFYTTCASEEEYEGAAEAKRIIDKFNERNNIDGLLQVTTREIVATGNGIWQLFTPSKLEKVLRVPIMSFERVITNEFLEFEETEFTKAKKIQLGFKQTTAYGGKLIPAENLHYFRWNPIDDSGWGSGVMRVLMEEYSWQEYNKNTGKYDTRTRQSFLEIKAQLDLDLIEIFSKFAGPLEAYVTEDKKLAEKIEAELQTMPKYGGRLVAAGKGGLNIKTPPLEPRARFGESIEYLWNQFCLGGQTPLPKLFTTPGFTEASANAAIDIADRLIMPIQRLIKRDVEKLWAKVIVAANTDLDPVKASVRLNWGIQKEPEFVTQDILKAHELGVVSRDEVRKILQGIGWKIETTKPEAMPEAKHLLHAHPKAVGRGGENVR